MRVSNKIKIYLAAPLFNKSERDFNDNLASLIGPIADVFLPQRDGKLMRDLLRGGMPLLEAQKLIFEEDIKAISHCDCLLAVLDGRTIDEGVAFEIGYARALNKICIGFKSDDRTLLPSGDNPMIIGGCNEIFNNVKDVMCFLSGNFR